MESTKQLLRVAAVLDFRQEHQLSYAVLSAGKLITAEDLGWWQKRLSTAIGIVLGLSHGAIEAAFLTLARIATPSRWKRPHGEVGGSLIAYARAISRAFSNLLYAIQSKATLHQKVKTDPGSISEKVYEVIDLLLVKQAHSIGAFLGALLVFSAVTYLLVKILTKISRKLAQTLRALIKWSTGKDPKEVIDRAKRFFLGLPARAKVELLTALTLLGHKLKGKESSLSPQE